MSPSVTFVKQGTNGFRVVQKPNPLLSGQSQLLRALRSVSGDRPGLAALLTNANPRVRTLALGALFQREDGRDLPIIASLINDSAPTFPDLHDGLNQMGGARPLSELTNSQTVGDVAQRMLAFWGVEHLPGGGYWTVTSSDFAAYWARYAGRSNSASWFAVKLKRATRRTTPIPLEYQPDVQKVLKEIASLPMPDRAWTELYVLAPQGWFEFDPGDEVVSDDHLLQMIKGLGPSALMNFLQRRKISDDPDLQMDKNNPEFVRLSNFILLHADKLLRPEDADSVLACEYVLRGSGAVNPAWAIGAALADPARAGKILRHALATQTDRENQYEDDAGDVTGALWRIRGPAEMNFLVNWFYTVPPMMNAPYGQQIVFLWTVEAAARPDTKQLIAALVKDPRFDRTDWNVLKEILIIVNTGRSKPLVAQSDIYAAEPNSLPNQQGVLVQWRNLLRHEYGLPEEPVPNLSPKPKHALTQPAWSLSVAGQCLQLALSPKGKLLAVLCQDSDRMGVGTISLFDAQLGKLMWKMPGNMSMEMGFPDQEHLIRLDHGGYDIPGETVAEWDIAARKKIRQTLLSGWPYEGVWDEGPAINRTAGRLGFSGYAGIACFDAKSGRALWTHNGDSGAGCVSALSPDGRFMAAGGGSDSVRVINLFDARTGKLLRQFGDHSGRVGAIAVSPDDGSLVTVTSEDGVRMWDIATGKLEREFSYPVAIEGGMDACMPAFSPDDRWLAIPAAWTETCRFKIGVFDVQTGDLEWEITHKVGENDSMPEALIFAPDGKTLYTVGSQLEAWPLTATMHFGDTAPLHSALANLNARVPELSAVQFSTNSPYYYADNAVVANYTASGRYNELTIIAKAYDSEAAAKAGLARDQMMIQAGWQKCTTIQGAQVFEYTDYRMIYLQTGCYTFELRYADEVDSRGPEFAARLQAMLDEVQKNSNAPTRPAFSSPTFSSTIKPKDVPAFLLKVSSALITALAPPAK